MRDSLACPAGMKSIAELSDSSGQEAVPAAPVASLAQVMLAMLPTAGSRSNVA